MHIISNRDERTFLLSGLTDFGDGSFTVQRPSTKPATLDVPIMIPAGVVRLLPEISCYADLGETEFLPIPEGAKGIAGIQPQRVDSKSDLRSIATDDAGRTILVNNLIEFWICDSNGQAITEGMKFRSRRPESHRFQLIPHSFVVLDGQPTELLLRLSFYGALKRLSRVTAKVEILEQISAHKSKRTRRKAAA